LGQDIGIANISAYSNGLMGYETPNIDRIVVRNVRANSVSKGDVQRIGITDMRGVP
jgi:hypothetical protein